MRLWLGCPQVESWSLQVPPLSQLRSVLKSIIYLGPPALEMKRKLLYCKVHFNLCVEDSTISSVSISQSHLDRSTSAISWFNSVVPFTDSHQDQSSAWSLDRSPDRVLHQSLEVDNLVIYLLPCMGQHGPCKQDSCRHSLDLIHPLLQYEWSTRDPFLAFFSLWNHRSIICMMAGWWHPWAFWNIQDVYLD